MDLASGRSTLRRSLNPVQPHSIPSAAVDPTCPFAPGTRWFIPAVCGSILGADHENDRVLSASLCDFGGGVVLA